jgi:hypothetical protein
MDRPPEDRSKRDVLKLAVLNEITLEINRKKEEV